MSGFCGLWTSQKTRSFFCQVDESQDIPEDKDPFMLSADATDEDKAKRFYNAGCILEEGKKARFSDDSLWSERELYIKAIELKPNFADPFHNLGACLDKGESVRLPGSSDDWNQQALYITAITFSSKNALYWLNLAISLNPQDNVTLHDGSLWDQRMLLLKSLELDDNEADVFYHLAKTYEIDDTERLKFPDGREWTEQDLYKKAIDLDSKHAEAYHDLGNKLAEDETVTLKHGKTFTKFELLAMAHELDSNLEEDTGAVGGA